MRMICVSLDSILQILIDLTSVSLADR